MKELLKELNDKKIKNDIKCDTLERNIKILQVIVVVWLIGLGILAMCLLFKQIGVQEQEVIKTCVDNGYTIEYCRSLLY